MKEKCPANDLIQDGKRLPGPERTVMSRHALCVYPYRDELGPRTRFYPPLGLEIIAAVLEPLSPRKTPSALRHNGLRSSDSWLRSTILRP